MTNEALANALEQMIDVTSKIANVLEELAIAVNRHERQVNLLAEEVFGNKKIDFIPYKEGENKNEDHH